MTTFTVNGQSVQFTGEARTHLGDFLREDMGLTGTHLGCEHGVCGACTLIKDGQPVRSCLTFAAACEGADIRTVEDFHDDPLMARIRAAFTTHHGLQCGFCTPGMLATAYDIVTRLPDADEARVREELAGNLCRCTGYMGIVAAIMAVLAEGPYVPATAPPRPPQIGTASFGVAGPGAVATPAKATKTARARPAPLTDGVRLDRTIQLDVPGADVWAVLSDIERVVACLPGAEAHEIDGDRVEGAFTTRIGPIAAAFRGTAFVTYDPSARTGRVSGTGGDGATRSNAAGEIGFALRDVGPDRCELSCDLIYRLSGPLAQVGRPGIVAGIVDRLLGDFTQNIAAAAKGEDVPSARPVSILRLILAALGNILRRS